MVRKLSLSLQVLHENNVRCCEAFRQLLTNRLKDVAKRAAQQIGPELSAENRVMFALCRTFPLLCRKSTSVVREADGMSTLMLLIESSNPNGSKVCTNLCGICYDLLVTASLFSNLGCLTALANFGLVFQLTLKIVKNKQT